MLQCSEACDAASLAHHGGVVRMHQDSDAFDKEWPGCFKSVMLVMRSHYHIMRGFD